MKQDGSDFICEYMPSITNFGIRPTLDGQKKLLETHILNYEELFKNNEIYNFRICVVYGAAVFTTVSFPIVTLRYLSDRQRTTHAAVFHFTYFISI